MSRKPVPAQTGERSRVEVNFDKPQLLPQLFGEFDSNILALEERLGVYIHARGQRVQIEGSAEAVAHAREVLQELHARVIRGEEVDTGLIDAVIAMSSEPTLTGIIKADNGNAPPPIMIRTRKKTIVPRSVAQTQYMRALVSNDMIFALGPAGTGKTYLAVAQAVAQLITGSVQRLILSRPAVEAGERLGFLPGELPLALSAPGPLRPLRLWVGIDSRRRLRRWLHPHLPASLRPSPLNLIFRDLTGNGRTLDPERVLFQAQEIHK